MTNLLIKVIGEGEYGPVTVTLNGETVTVRINPAGERRRFRCSACGVQTSINECEHLQLAVIARTLADGTHPHPEPTPTTRSESE